MAPHQQLKIDEQRHGDVVVLRCAGEIDLATVGDLRAHLQEALVEAPPRVVLVLDDVAFMDSIGLGVLIGAHKRARVLQGSFAIVCTSPQVLTLLRATSLDRVFRIVSDLGDALEGERV